MQAPETAAGPAFFQTAPTKALLQNPLYLLNVSLLKLSSNQLTCSPASQAAQSLLTPQGETVG